jgi:Recombination endonuclease VII
MGKTLKQITATRSWVKRNLEKVRADARRRYHAMTPEEHKTHALKHRLWQQKNRDRVNADKRHAHAHKPGVRWAPSLRQKYGISEGHFFSLLADQHGNCAGCGIPLTLAGKRAQTACIDHDHAKKKGDEGFIRGLLCANCNRALGLVHESVAHLRLLIQYLQEHGRE